MDNGLESEIDDALGGLELNGAVPPSHPSATFPGHPFGQPREGAHRDSAVPSAANGLVGRSERPVIGFPSGSDEATKSAPVVPRTGRDSMPTAQGPMATEGSHASSGEGSGSLPPPLTVEERHVDAEGSGVMAVTGESPITHQDRRPSETVDVEGAAGVDEALESTHAGAKSDEIVIADDLAEDVADDPHDPHDPHAPHGGRTHLHDEDHTDAGAPPFRSERS